MPEIRAWLRGLPRKPEIFVEPFAGGGIASLTVVFEDLADRAVMVELDHQVAAVWKVILREGPWLAEKIRNYEMSIAHVRETLAIQPDPDDLRTVAFQTILRNRVQRGGIMAPGASMIKYGENGKGVTSRWYPETLAKRINAIYEHRNRLEFIEEDAFVIIPRYLGNPAAAFFIDPPYTASRKRAGSRLYSHSKIDHEALFRLMAQAKGDFLMTYDDAEEVEAMAAQYGYYVKRVPMKTTHHATVYELLISRASV